MESESVSVNDHKFNLCINKRTFVNLAIIVASGSVYCSFPNANQPGPLFSESC